MNMHRSLCVAAVLACACGSAPPSTSLAGVWGGNALTNFSFGSVGEKIAMKVTVAGNTATLTGICGGAGVTTTLIAADFDPATAAQHPLKPGIKLAVKV